MAVWVSLADMPRVSLQPASKVRIAILLPGLLALFALFASASPAARAGQADVVEAEATCRPAPGGRAASICSFSASVKHRDTGWDHYANRWDVVGPDGEVLGSRQLRHPHVDEQPFRRSLGRVRIQHATKSVTVRAFDSVHGLGGAEVVVVVPHVVVAPAPEDAAPQPAP